MKKRKLNYVIHNPNTIEITTEILLKVLIDANFEKVEKTMREAADSLEPAENTM